MPAPKVSDQEFIEAFRIHKSVARVAEHLGMHEQNVNRRRRNMERIHKIQLEASHPCAAKYAHLSPQEHKPVHQLGIENGDVIIFSDAHFVPGERTTALKGLLHLIKELQPRAVICNGDAFDGAQISRWPRIGWDKTPNVLQELKATQACLNEIEEVAGRAKLVWPLGNHDARFENRLAQVAPQYEGVQGFSLKDHFPAWIPCWATWINDSTIVKHRYKGGIHATRNNTLNAGKSIFTGHLHQLKVTPLADYNGNRYGVDTGTLAEPSGEQFVNYTEAGPLDWRSGFVVASFHKGRLLLPQIAQTWEPGKIEFRGKLLDVSKE